MDQDNRRMYIYRQKKEASREVYWKGVRWMIKIFKLIKNVSKQNIYRLTAKEQKHKQLQIPTEGRVPVREKPSSGDPQRRDKTS